MSDSIRYYSTNKNPMESMGEVGSLLVRYGAQRFEQVFEAGRITAVRFNLPMPRAEFGHINIVLKPRVEALRAKLKERHRIEDEEQVQRVAWRQLKGILEGILMAVDTGMFTTPELFLGMAETRGGVPLWEHLTAHPEVLMLQSGEEATDED